MLILSWQQNEICRKDNKFLTVTAVGIIDSYYYGMDSLLKEINMIVSALEYGNKKYTKKQDSSSIPSISPTKIGKNKYLWVTNGIPIAF